MNARSMYTEFFKNAVYPSMGLHLCLVLVSHSNEDDDLDESSTPLISTVLMLKM